MWSRRALSYQTNDFYNTTITGSPWTKTPSDDILHVVKVPYANSSVLRAQASTTVKDDFAWIPLSEFFNYKHVSRKLTNGVHVNVSNGVASMIKAYAPNLVTFLTTSARQRLNNKLIKLLKREFSPKELSPGLTFQERSTFTQKGTHITNLPISMKATHSFLMEIGGDF